ncbi:hypothetical protein L2088_02500 [Pseudomonas protegens]|uniref:hypothetical protein n=1 Tax=Pseudomonas protegens TaxID=380021 RepID=UPI002024AC4B|nr:hypothetical protein [Pseudomonas protegens]MCL9653564.1 hypothetical protein [Pseudomonas protegens]
MSNLIVVRFLKAWRGYSAEELAGFDEAVVVGLEAKGFAERYEEGGDGRPSRKGRSSASKAASKPAESGSADTSDSGAGNASASGAAGIDGADDEKP